MTKTKILSKEEKVNAIKLKHLIRSHGDCGRRLWLTTQKWEKKANRIKKRFSKKIIGLSLEDAEKLAEKRGYKLLINKKSEPLNYDSIFIKIENNLVVSTKI